ncbi:MAG: hypothetical protein ACI86M_003422 [Saprospiraceae bacterium]|jgi:hypothetical protein
MKYLVSSVVFILIAVVPFGSWYYLQTGLNYRKDALKELAPKGLFSSDGFDNSILKSKTTLFQLKNLDEQILPEIFDQYSNSETYQVVAVESPVEPEIKWITISQETANAISLKYDNAGFILVDTSMMIRNSYSADMNGIRRMIEHTSIILPRIKEMDIKMKK